MFWIRWTLFIKEEECIHFLRWHVVIALIWQQCRYYVCGYFSDMTTVLILRDSKNIGICFCASKNMKTQYTPQRLQWKFRENISWAPTLCHFLLSSLARFITFSANTDKFNSLNINSSQKILFIFHFYYFMFSSPRENVVTGMFCSSHKDLCEMGGKWLTVAVLWWDASWISSKQYVAILGSSHLAFSSCISLASR